MASDFIKSDEQRARERKLSKTTGDVMAKNWTHLERRLILAMADLQRFLRETVGYTPNAAADFIDEGNAVVHSDLAEAGIDMEPAYARLREMIDRARSLRPMTRAEAEEAIAGATPSQMSPEDVEAVMEYVRTGGKSGGLKAK